MKKVIRAASFVMTAIFLLATILSGCSSGANKLSSTNNAASGQKSNSTGQADTAKKELAPYEMVVALQLNEQKDRKLVEEKISALAKEKLNATVKLLFISGANWVQQTNLMSASNEKLDLLWTSSFYGYNNVVAKGQIIPLDSLLEKYGSDIKNVLTKETLDACKVTGKLYGIPSTRDMAADYGVMMRKDLLDKYNIKLDQVKTMEDLTPVFKTIKEKEPDMVATTGFSAYNTIPGLIYKGTFDPLDDRFGVLRLKDNNLKLLNLYETPEYKNIVDIVRKWYVAGYISKDAATTTESPFNRVKANKLFSYFYSFKPGVEAQETVKLGTNMVKVGLTDITATTSNITVMMSSISKNSQDPDRVMMLINQWFKDNALVNLFDNGIEGVHYKKVSDNTIDYADGVNATTTGWTANNYTIGNNFLSYVWKGVDPNVWTETDKFNKSAIKSKAFGFSFDQEPVKTEEAAAANVVAEYRMGIETGTLDPAAYLPEFNTKLKAAGLEKIIAEKQRQLDEWAKGQK